METIADRKARLWKAAGDAIEQAIVKGGNPTELMMAATGEGNTICALYVPQHPLYWENRRQFRTREDREREERRVAKKRRDVTSVNTSIATLRKAASEEAARLVRLAAEPLTTRDTVNRCMQRAATRLGWSYTRVEDVWRKEARRIESWEMDQLRVCARVPVGRKITQPARSGDNCAG